MNKKTISAKPRATRPASLSPLGAAVESKGANGRPGAPAIPERCANYIRRIESAVEIIEAGAGAAARLADDPPGGDEDRTRRLALSLQPLRCAAGIRPDYSLAGAFDLRGIMRRDSEYRYFFAWCGNVPGCKVFAEHWGELNTRFTKAAISFADSWRRCGSVFAFDIQAGFLEWFEDIIDLGPASENDIRIFAGQLDAFEISVNTSLTAAAKRSSPKSYPVELAAFFADVYAELPTPEIDDRGRAHYARGAFEDTIVEVWNDPKHKRVYNDYSANERRRETLLKHFRSWRKKNHPDGIREKATPAKRRRKMK